MKVKAHKISMAILYVLIALVFATIVVKAEETTSEQSLDLDQNYIGANIQAEMPAAKQKQKMHIHLNIFSINVQYIRTESISNIEK